MRIVFFGTPQFAVPTLEKLINHPHFEVISVVTQPDKRRGRGSQLMPSPVKKVALEHQIPVLQPKSVKKNQTVLNTLNSTRADAFIVIAYGQILSKQILEMPKLGCINVHGSILPNYRGAAPIQWCLYHGEQETGITTILMNEGMDTGDMLLKAYTSINLLDNAHDLAIKLAQQGADLLIETLLKLEAGELQPIPQNPDEATYAPLIQKEDYMINWSASSMQIHNQIRAFYPNCLTHFRDQPLKVLETIPIDQKIATVLPPEYAILEQQSQGVKGDTGEIVNLIKKWGAVIQTGDGLLFLKTVQPAGKRPQSGWNFVNGMRLRVGEKFTEWV